jgi:hypothetical protein
MKLHKIRVYRVGESHSPIHEEVFIGSNLEASRRLTDVWNEKTPCDGTGFRATLHTNRKLRDTIGA